MSEDADAIVQGLQGQLRRIGGLITVRASEGRVVALVADRMLIPSVRSSLLALEVPRAILDVVSAKDYLISYPNQDERLMAWLEGDASPPDDPDSGGGDTQKEWEDTMAEKGSSTPGAGQREELLETLKARFEANMDRHEGIEWEQVRARLEAEPGKLRSLIEMEKSGGEPDVTGRDESTGEYLFVDCSPESPKGRRRVCYDREALEARKKHKPEASAVELATAMGADLLTEAEYRSLQELGPFDTKTSSWLQTPPDIRGRGGAIFGDYRYGTVFIYHNGAESYYAARGFRCTLRV